jgi:hypothetical protein
MSAESDVIDQFIAQVRATTPVTDTSSPFYIVDDGTGGCVPLEAVAESAPSIIRACDVRIAGMPRDEGLDSATALRFRIGIAVRVYYGAGFMTDRNRLELMAAEDCRAIIDRLSDPSNWGSGVVDTIITSGQPAPSTTSVAGSDPSAAGGWIVSIPFEALYQGS